MLEIITSDHLPFTHGFFTRKGGASSGIFAGLNCGHGSSDQQEIVQINCNRVAEAMGVAPERLCFLHQCHSADVVTITVPLASDIRYKADAMVTNVPNLALSILTADCQPILMADPEARIVGAAHAGWKGALAGVIEASIDAMERLGADRRRIIAVIGPCIGPDSYEVGADFRERFIKAGSSHTRFFRPTPDGKYLFDLPAFGLDRLQRAGIVQAEWTGQCTCSDPDLFFSYRRSTRAREVDYGRQVSVIRL